MKITDESLEDGVLEIFLRNNVSATGRLAMADLYQEWSGLHFRIDDLDAAITRLIACGDLKEELDQGALYIALTQQGLQRSLSLPTASARTLWNYLKGFALFWVAQSRRPSRNAVRQHRRREDRPATDRKAGSASA